MRTFPLPLLLLVFAVGCTDQPSSEDAVTGQSVAAGVVSEIDAAVDVEIAPLEIKEWDVPWERTRPRDPYVAPDGRVWFCGQTGGYLAVLDPDTGEFEQFDIGEGAGPHNLIVDDEGMVWYAGNRRAHIGMLNPETGEVTRYPMPREDARDPHTLVWDADGNIWFTLQGSNMVGHLNRESGEVRLVEVPTSGARPYGIWMDSNDTPWIALFGTNKLATVDPETMELTEIEIPHEDSRPRRLVITSDDRVWYGDYSRGALGVYDPADGSFDEWPMPSGDRANPYAMEVDDQDRVWFVETGVNPNVFAGFDPETESYFSSAPVPSGGGTLRHMYFHAPTNSIWFGADTNTIGRATLPE